MVFLYRKYMYNKITMQYIVVVFPKNIFCNIKQNIAKNTKKG